MVFSSNIFITFFLPAFLAFYYLVPRSSRPFVVVAGSWSFYGWWDIGNLPILVAVTIWVYFVGGCLERAQENGDIGRKRALLTLGIVGVIATLIFYKYWRFLLDNLTPLLQPDLIKELRVFEVILPIGISFYTFQSISYLVDVFRGSVPAARKFRYLAAFIGLFPQLIAGPILRYKDMAEQLQRPNERLENFAEGVRRFTLGLAKKILIADAVAPIADAAFSHGAPTAAEAWLGLIAYTVQLYFDFSGYSDMAIGLGLMIGLRFPENFASPYESRSIAEFWTRWHITLSSWMRDYLYIPMGGNRGSIFRTCQNLMVTMLLGGLWHGASWNFVIWGAWHGLWLTMERVLGQGGKRTPYPAKLARPLTVLIVLMGWVVFRSSDISSALQFYAGLAGAHGTGLSGELLWQTQGYSMALLVIGSLLIIIPARVRDRLVESLPATNASGWMREAALATLVILSLSRLQYQSYTPNLYFQF
ncbi:MAG: MBOAT family protein [Proteobacteria bacterium]|nr:MBOAT family protein [Pseudomonadota bacterium]